MECGAYPAGLQPDRHDRGVCGPTGVAQSHAGGRTTAMTPMVIEDDDITRSFFLSGDHDQHPMHHGGLEEASAPGDNCLRGAQCCGGSSPLSGLTAEPPASEARRGHRQRRPARRGDREGHDLATLSSRWSRPWTASQAIRATGSHASAPLRQPRQPPVRRQPWLVLGPVESDRDARRWTQTPEARDYLSHMAGVSAEFVAVTHSRQRSRQPMLSHITTPSSAAVQEYERLLGLDLAPTRKPVDPSTPRPMGRSGRFDR